MMFKILVLQRYYNLSESDKQIQFQILDRLSCIRFLGLTLSDSVPDEKAIWLFRENLIEHKFVDKLFDKFLCSLEKANLVSEEWRMLDAHFVEVPLNEITSKIVTVKVSRTTKMKEIIQKLMPMH